MAFYITTAISYVNGVPHLGHVFEAVGTDVQARYQRLLGEEVFFLTGTDEHGQKNAQSAAAKGVTPLEHVTEVANVFQRVWKDLDISYDGFIRTTEPRHHRASQLLWETVQANGDIYLGKYEGWYDVKEEAFITESEMRAQGLEPDGKRIRRMAEDAYFFRMEKWRPRIREHILANPDFIQPESRRNEVLNSFLADELPDLCISRTSMDWGIPVPGAPGHVMYVWFDALTNYITGVGYADPGRADSFAKFWPADVHVIGKDIVKFHAVIWPAMLMAAGIAPPKRVFGHGFVNVATKDAPGGGEKMSKSLGNVIDPMDYVRQYGAEPLRYFLMREINFGSDGVFSPEAMRDRYTADLANTLGNLVSRTAGMVEKYMGGAVRRTADTERRPAERAIVAAWDATVAEYERAMPLFEYHLALGKTWDFLIALNKAISDEKPWDMAKDPARAVELRVFLTVVIEGIAGAASLLEPFMPTTAVRIRKAVGVSHAPTWGEARRFGGVMESATMTKPEPLFPRPE